MRLSLSGSEATPEQVRRKFALQKYLKLANLRRLVENFDLDPHIPIGYRNAILTLDKTGQIEFLSLSVKFTEHNADWNLFLDYLIAKASSGLMRQLCQIAFAENLKHQIDIHPDIDDTTMASLHTAHRNYQRNHFE